MVQEKGQEKENTIRIGSNPYEYPKRNNLQTLSQTQL